MLVEKIEFSVADLLADFASLMGFRAREKGIEFRLRMTSALPEVIISDPTRLRQILNNVVGNAIKFTERGRVTMDVELREELLAFSVTDTGLGITTAQAAQLFRPFHQADPSTTRRFGGTGLGLMLTRRLTELMGGAFTLERSEPGRGSCFRATIKIRLPETYGTVGVRELKRLAKRRPPGGQPAGDLNGLRCLVIEDSPDNQVLIKLLLTKLGANVLIAGDGVDGVAAAEAAEFDVILCDVQMPRMDGYAVLAYLRERHYRVPIVALTAHAMKEERDRALTAGFDAYLTKPIQRDLLVKTLSSVRDGGRGEVSP